MSHSANRVDEALTLAADMAEHGHTNGRETGARLLAETLLDEGATLEHALAAAAVFAEAALDGEPDDAADRQAIASAVVRAVYAEGRIEVQALGADEPATYDTDTGNARRLIADHGHDLRHVPGIGWLAWDGQRWRPDDDGEIVRRAQGVTDGLLDHARRLAAAGLSDKADRQFKWGLRSQQAARIKAMVELAGADREVVARPDRLDADPWKLNVSNGTLNLRTGELHAHERGDLITAIAPVTHDPTAACATFERFLSDLTGGDAELAAYLRAAAGYTLTGDTSEQVLFVLHGEGGNGKTTLLETIGSLLGDGYSRQADAASFTTAASGRSVRSDLARLRAARYVRAAEVDRGATLAESLIKQITGGERIVAAHKFRDEFEYRPAFKLWLAVNDLPAVLSDTRAIWRRIVVIPCPAEVAQPDKHLLDKLRAELPGILNWALAGTRDWLARGLPHSEAVRQASAAYRGAQDRVGAFLDELCEPDPTGRVDNRELTTAYAAWERAHGREPHSDLHARLTRLGYGSVKSNGKRYRTGLRLRGGDAG